MVKSFARFTSFARGKIVGKAEEGASRNNIRKEVRKKDGKRASLKAIDQVLAHARQDPNWQGTDSVAGGRPQELRAADLARTPEQHEDTAIGPVPALEPKWLRTTSV